ncbi:hypothetical protein KVR01_001571 [Diaporthe batatas]|uniref:uncharacterized protein n=1 Tax=Diaporthe batatas TaxID=748121 RepID=UPI001D043456|nr:uncharacterized protein KVR01_001571 [Diaporthe batatas]KAG8168822.1 hypothetical protein KVR01_001571 [Diaporthe batatas]
MADQTADGAAVAAADVETTPAVAAASLDRADDTTHKRRAEDNAAASPRKKPRNDQAEAETSDGVDEGQVDSDSESKASASSKKPGRTWNSGITTQLRTSFGSSSRSSKSNAAKPSPKPTAAPDEHPPPPGQLAPEVCNELVATVKAGEASVLPAVKEHERTWELPPFKADFQGETWDDIFRSMFSQWSTDFMSTNQANVEAVGLGHKFLTKMYLQTLNSLPGVNQTLVKVSQAHLHRTSKRSLLKRVAKGWKESPSEGTRRKNQTTEQTKVETGQENQPPEEPKQPPKRQTRASSKKAESTPDSDTGRSADSSDRKPSAASSGPSIPDSSVPPLSDLTAEKQPPSATEDDVVPMYEGQDEGQDEPGKDQRSNNMFSDRTKAESKTVAPTEDELEQRHRYFPGVTDDAVFCLTCASYGHNTSGCPEATCKFCQQDHFSYSCPSRQRCTKCKQLGHAKASCKEKLAVAAGEGFMECAFCQAQDHQEEQCPEIWETYRPNIGHIKQVRSVPIFCYCCGAEGHFGTDCGLADRKLPPSATWSNAGASLYIDPASLEEAIAFRNPLPGPQADSAPVIPGRSIKPQSHIIFEDSGDEDASGQGFLRAPASGPRRQGQIQITSNINFGAPAGPSAQNGGAAQQDSSQAGKRRKQRAANGPASLPPKPQTAAPAPPQQASKKGKNNKKNGKNPQQKQQQPPLPPGPPPGSRGWRPPEFQARSSNSSRGRGGFSSLGRGGRRGGGRN